MLSAIMLRITCSQVSLSLHVINNTIADSNGCIVNVDYEPPEDGLVRDETYVAFKKKVKI